MGATIVIIFCFIAVLALILSLLVVYIVGLIEERNNRKEEFRTLFLKRQYITKGSIKMYEGFYGDVETWAHDNDVFEKVFFDDAIEEPVMIRQIIALEQGNYMLAIEYIGTGEISFVPISEMCLSYRECDQEKDDG